MEDRGEVFEDQETGQRFTVVGREEWTLTVYDHGAGERRTVNRILWEADLEAGRLRPERGAA
jgi:hypothetical protein